MRIYAIDDEPKMLRLLTDAIAEAEPGAEIFSFSSAADVLKALENRAKAPHAVFTDVEMPGMTGLQLAVKIKAAAPQARIVFVTGYDRYALDAYKLHVHGYVLKPVDADAVREELNELPQIPASHDRRLFFRCFGPFEVFDNGRPLFFERRKTKELLAYLVDRRGATCTAEELAAVLWEEEPDMDKAKHRIRNCVNDLRATLKGIGREDVLVRKSGLLAINAAVVDCDYYRLLIGDADAVNAYHGEYMTQYSWAELTAGALWFEWKKSE